MSSVSEKIDPNEYEVSDVMQTFEDALLKELIRVFPGFEYVPSSMAQDLSNNTIVFTNRISNLTRVSTFVARRTIMTDIAVITDKGQYWAENSLARLASIKIGEIEKLITGARTAIVDNVVHLSFYTYLTEIQNLEQKEVL